MTGKDPQIKVKETLNQVFDKLSIERKAEVLEFAVFMWAREVQEPVYLSLDLDHLISQLGPASNQSSRSLQGSVLHYDAPFEPVAVEDWKMLQ